MKKLLLGLTLCLQSWTAQGSDLSIIGGTKVESGKYPFMVSIKFRYGDDWNGHFCGGSLISSQVVLTAAHCMEGQYPQDLEVTAGRVDLSSSGYGVQRQLVDSYIIHPNYNRNTLNHDIALVFLAQPFSLNYMVGTIDYRPMAFHKKRQTVIGWGNTNTSRPYYPKDLMEVDVYHIPYTECNKSDWMDGQVTGNMFCAGYGNGGKDSCQGDSGGPLFIQDSNGELVQTGIVSWGEGCVLEKRPGIYTKIKNYSGWIDSLMTAGR